MIKNDNKKILIGIPTKNAESYLGNLGDQLTALDYPKNLISVALVIGDSIDNTKASALNLKKRLLMAGFGEVHVNELRTGFHLTSESRHIEGYQKQRLLSLCITRQFIVDNFLRDNDYLFWIDSDYSVIPSNILQILLSYNVDFVIPTLRLPDGSLYDGGTHLNHKLIDEIEGGDLVEIEEASAHAFIKSDLLKKCNYFNERQSDTFQEQEGKIFSDNAKREGIKLYASKKAIITHLLINGTNEETVFPVSERGIRIFHLYEKYLNRTPDLVGFQSYLNSSITTDEIENCIQNSDEAIDQKNLPQIRTLLSLLKPMDVHGLNLVRKGRNFDGGYTMLDFKLENSLCYSLGIGDDVSWDLEMAEMGCQIYQYDHTIENFPKEHPNFHSFKIGICALPADESNLKTIDEIISSNRHENEDSIILKMDIEGAEWSIFREIQNSTLEKFSQIIVEIHGLERYRDPDHFALYLKALDKLSITHQVIHIHANNYGSISKIGRYRVPDVVELTYVRKKDHIFTVCNKLFPTSIDMPCHPGRPDYFLGAMGLL